MILLLQTLVLVSAIGVDCQKFLIAGHRGAAGIYPAHTVPAYQEGAKFSDLIECDVALTKDLELIETFLRVEIKKFRSVVLYYTFYSLNLLTRLLDQSNHQRRKSFWKISLNYAFLGWKK